MDCFAYVYAFGIIGEVMCIFSMEGQFTNYGLFSYYGPIRRKLLVEALVNA